MLQNKVTQWASGCFSFLSLALLYANFLFPGITALVMSIIIQKVRFAKAR